MSSSVQPGGGVGNTHSHAHKFSFSSLLSYTETWRQLPRSTLCRIFHLSPADFPVTHGKDLGLPSSAHCRHDASSAAILSSCKTGKKHHVVPCIIPVIIYAKRHKRQRMCEDLQPAALRLGFAAMFVCMKLSLMLTGKIFTL